MSQKIRIKLKSFDHMLVDKSAAKIVDTVKPAVGIELKLLAGLLVDEGRAVYSEDLRIGGKGNGAIHLCAGRLHCVNDLCCGLVHEHMIERLEFNSDFLAHIKIFYLDSYSSSSADLYPLFSMMSFAIAAGTSA